MGQTTDAVAVTVTSTRLIVSQNGLSLVFGGQDIIRAEALNAPSHPSVNTVPNAWFIRLYLTGPIREVYTDGHYDILLNAVSSPSTWNDKVDPRGGALVALAAITPMIRSAPSGGGGGQVDTIVPGAAIDVDSTDPVNPIVNVKVDGVTIGINGLNELEVPAGGGGYVPTTRQVNTTLPLTGGGALTGDLTLDINNFGSGTDGAVPASGGGTTNFLRADGTWAAPPDTTGITQLTGDVTAGPGSGSQVATLASVIAAGGPTGSATVTPIITYDAKGRLTAVSSATVTPAVGSITGLGTGVSTALGNNADSASGFVTQTGGDARYLTPFQPTLLSVAGPLSTTSTSLANVTGAVFSSVPVGMLEVQFMIDYDASATTVGAYFSIDGTVTQNYLGVNVLYNTTQGDNPSRSSVAFNSGGTSSSSRTTTGNVATVNVRINVTVSGTIQLRYATESAGNAITIQSVTGFLILLG